MRYLALVLLAGCAWLRTPAAAEPTYTGELLACTAAAKAHHPGDSLSERAAGRTESKACECAVDVKWGVPCG